MLQELRVLQVLRVLRVLLELQVRLDLQELMEPQDLLREEMQLSMVIFKFGKEEQALLQLDIPLIDGELIFKEALG